MIRGIYVSIIYSKYPKQYWFSRPTKGRLPSFFGNTTEIIEDDYGSKNDPIHCDSKLYFSSRNKKRILLGYNTLYYQYFKEDNYKENIEKVKKIIKEIKKYKIDKSSNRNYIFIVIQIDNEKDLFKKEYKNIVKVIRENLNIENENKTIINDPEDILKNISNEKIYAQYVENDFFLYNINKSTFFMDAYFLSYLFFYYNFYTFFINRRTLYRFYYFWKKNIQSESLISNSFSVSVFEFFQFTYQALYFLFHIFDSGTFLYEIINNLFPQHNFIDRDYIMKYLKESNPYNIQETFKEKLIKMWKNLSVFSLGYIGGIIALIGFLFSILK